MYDSGMDQYKHDCMITTYDGDGLQEARRSSVPPPEDTPSSPCEQQLLVHPVTPRCAGREDEEPRPTRAMLRSYCS